MTNSYYNVTEFQSPVQSGPKISFFLNTAHSDSEAPVGNAGNAGNVVKFFTFTMAWKCFCYVSEVSGLIHKYNNHMIV